MSENASRAPWLEERRTFWLVALLIGLLFSLTNLPWQLDDYDQAKQAFTSFEMVNSGHWLFQHTPNEKIATKPPLVGWISAALYAVTHSWEAAWRLPSIAAAIALAVVLVREVGAAYGRTAVLLSFAAFGLNLLTPRLATLVRTDMPLALAVFLLGLQIWRKVRTAEPWTGRDRLITFALLTCAMLIKGPIVYAFLLPGIVLYQLHRRAHGTGGSAWSGWWPWIASLAIFLAWTAAGIAWVPGFHDQVVVKEFAGRFSETVHRPQPIFFYLPHLLHKFAPWSVLLIALAVVARRRDAFPFRERVRRLAPDVVWLLCWSLGGLAVMSLIPSKRVDRIFPVVPPLCLLVGAQAAAFATIPRLRRWMAVALVFAAFFATGYAIQRVAIGYRSDDAALVRFGEKVRQQAADHGWRYEVIGGREEGLLLYLRRTRFITVEKAAARWNAGTLDAVVIPADELALVSAALPGSTAAGPEAAIMINDTPRRYLLLQRR